jgi:hypothetical protein
MHTLSELIQTIRKEQTTVPANNLAFKTFLGQSIITTARFMIATSSGNWMPLTPATIDYKAYKKYGFQGDPQTPLYASGDFYRDMRYEIQGPAVSIGTNMPYMKYVEMGTAKMPPRPIFLPAFLKALPAIHTLIPKLYLRSLR